MFVKPELQRELRQPIWGWFGQRNQFAMGAKYHPQEDIRRFLAGTPPVIALAATMAGVRSITAIGIENLRRTSIELTEYLIEEATRFLVPLGFARGSPREASKRGGHVLLTHPHAHGVSVAMRQQAKVIGDFRQPNGLRLAPAPAYTTLAQVKEAVERIAAVVKSGQPERVDLTGQLVT